MRGGRRRLVTTAVLALAVAGCWTEADGHGRGTAGEPTQAVTHLTVTFEVPRDLEVAEDYLAFACGRNREPGVFLGVGYGFCPFGDGEPPGPSIYVGPYYQAAMDDSNELETPVPLPADVTIPAGMEEEEQDLVRWVGEDEVVFPELNVSFRFHEVDDELRVLILDSVRPAD